MWVAIVPNALLNQNFSVLKALFSDYYAAQGGSESSRTQAMGRLGISVGLAFMVGPAVGAMLFGSYQEVMLGALCFALLSVGVISILPMPKAVYTTTAEAAVRGADIDIQTVQAEEEKVQAREKEMESGFLAFLCLPTVQTPDAGTASSRAAVHGASLPHLHDGVDGESTLPLRLWAQGPRLLHGLDRHVVRAGAGRARGQVHRIGGR